MEPAVSKPFLYKIWKKVTAVTRQKYESCRRAVVPVQRTPSGNQLGPFSINKKEKVKENDQREQQKMIWYSCFAVYHQLHTIIRSWTITHLCTTYVIPKQPHVDLVALGKIVSNSNSFYALLTPHNNIKYPENNSQKIDSLMELYLHSFARATLMDWCTMGL